MSSESGAGQWHRWERDLFFPLLATLVVSLFVVFVLTSLDGLIPWFRKVTGYPALIVAAAVESIYVSRLAKQRGWGTGHRLRELIVLVLAARVVVALGAEGGGGLPGLLSLAGFTERNFLVHVIALILSWLWGISFNGDFEHLTYELPAEGLVRGSDAYESWFATAKKRLESGRTTAIWLRYFAFALAILILLNVYQQVVISSPQAIRSYRRLLWLGGSFYVVGIVLLSYTRYLRLRIGWVAKGYRDSSPVAKGWLRTSAAVAIVAAGLAFLLPANYSPWVGKTTWITKLLTALFPFSKSMEEAAKAGQQMQSLAAALAKTARMEGDTGPVNRTIVTTLIDFLSQHWSVIRTGLLIVAAGLVLLYLVLPILRGGRQWRFSWRNLGRLLKRAMEAALAVVKALVGYLASLLAWILSLLLRGRGIFRKEKDLASLLGLSPSARLKRAGLSKQALYILELYRRLIDLAARCGFPYRRTQTASEYSTGLGTGVPEIKTRVDSLTDILLKVRYGGEELGKEERRQADEHWEDIRRSLEELASGRAAAGARPDAQEGS